MIIYRTQIGILIESAEQYVLVNDKDWNAFINDDQLFLKCQSYLVAEPNEEGGKLILNSLLLKPIDKQEIWAAGVTYYNSKMARQEESKDAGGADFYAKVYQADRPELFFKSTGRRAVGHNEKVAIRKDSSWNVPEPELTLLITSNEKIVGYTIGNDMSSRSIEGENPLYLPQAKTYDRSAAIGPGILVMKKPIPKETQISLSIFREDEVLFTDSIRIEQIKRSFPELVSYLFRETSFPYGCFLMTGTGIVPDNDFTLIKGDEIVIEIEHIGKLVNIVA